MRLQKFLLIAVIVIGFIGVWKIYFLIPKGQEKKNNETTSLWQPKILIDEYSWKKELPNRAVAEENIPEIIKAANNFISEKIGKEFFERYIKYYPYRSSVSNSGEIYYLHYLVIIPEKGIDFKTTTHPVEIELTIKKDLSLIKPDEIARLPDCHKISSCLNYLNKDKAIKAVIADMDKIGYRAPEILFDWKLNSLQWFIRYDLPSEKLPNCKFKMGGSVSIYFDSFNDKIIKRQEDCNFPGI